MELTDEMWDDMMINCAKRTRELFEDEQDNLEGIETE